MFFCKQKVFVLVFIFLLLLFTGCSVVKDQLYHPVCSSPKKTCSERKLKEAVKLRNDVYIGETGWSACLERLPAKPETCKSNLSKNTFCPCDRKKYKNNIRTRYHEAWMEYKDTGLQHDPNQLKAIVRWITRHNKRSSKPLMIVAYINGWHNDANNSDNDPRNNAVKFSFMMARYVDTLKRLQLSGKIRSHEVLGIYIGWRGEKYRDTIRSLFSINGRSKVADKIGEAGVLRRNLKRIAGLLRSRDKILIMGHSLGGRMLTSTFRSELNANTVKPPLGRNSMMVTVNAAVGADCYEKVFGDRKRIPQTTRPYWVNITSENDSATGTIYGFGKLLGLIESCNPKSKARFSAIGHYEPYLRQVIDEASCMKLECPDKNCTMCTIENTTSEKKKRLACYLRKKCSKGNLFKQKQCYASELGWFKKYTSKRFPVGFPSRKNINSKNEKIRFCRIDFELKDKELGKKVLTSNIWNVRTDESLIDFGDEGGGGILGKHNAYISTVLIRLLTEMMFTPYRLLKK